MIGLSSTTVHYIENDRPVSEERGLDAIKKAWGFDSFDALIKVAEGLQHPPKEVTDEMRNAFRRLRHHRHDTPSNSALTAGEIATIEGGYNISVGKMAEVIKRAWAFQSFEQLIEAAKGLPPAPERNTRGLRG